MTIARTMARHRITEKPFLRFKARSAEGEFYFFDIEGHPGRRHTIRVEAFWRVPEAPEYVPKTPPALELFERPRRTRQAVLTPPDGVVFIRADEVRPGDVIRRRTGKREFTVLSRVDHATDPGAKVRITWTIAGVGVRSADGFNGEKFILISREP